MHLKALICNLNKESEEMQSLMHLRAYLGLLTLLIGLDELFSDLVSVHTGRRHLDRSLPVEIVVAEVESELFEDLLPNGGVVVGNIEMSRRDATLCGVLRDQVEVVLSVVVRVLNEVLVDQSSRWRIDHSALGVLGEKALTDSLVDDHHSDVRLAGLLVVHVFYGFIELTDFLLEHSSSLGVANTVSENNDVSWHLSIVV